MKVIFPFNRDLNPLVSLLISGLRDAGCFVDQGTMMFWDRTLFDYDIVHIQWPETLFDWRIPTEIELILLRQRLQEIRQRAKIIYTVHNRESHHANSESAAILKELYTLVEQECDVMVHLGEASKAEYQNRPEFTRQQHVMIPIPVYDALYSQFLSVTPKEAKGRLGVPQNKKIVLAFGNFRYEQEKQLVLSAVSALKKRHFCLVAPKWYKAHEYFFSFIYPMLSLRSARKYFWAWRNGLKLGVKKTMSDEEVALYFTAADVVFIQRVDELNSGNIPMAFLFRKTVLGPDQGNIGQWLRLTGNPVFDPVDNFSLQSALENALKLSDTDKGEENYTFAMTHWLTKKICMEHEILYKSVFNDIKIQ
ncbi:hypothetical protein [Desulfobulbus alkaliphilus]|uniref:hypothetical protein n=1 Tax=Desulfobulbus alkaliphilus TaxID=869814 RepID=UPI001963282C|nr:hypothetical protein [Desulfobulbus alkaliphilus]MBM9538186.1 hypothetical protein [Desulfobulbus alkaliphilus]